MMYFDFSSVKESDMVSIARPNLTEVTRNSIFTTPDAFIEDSFTLSVRGLSRSPGVTADYEILDNHTFEVHCPLDDGDNMTITYLKR